MGKHSIGARDSVSNNMLFVLKVLLRKDREVPKRRFHSSEQSPGFNNVTLGLAFLRQYNLINFTAVVCKSNVYPSHRAEQ